MAESLTDYIRDAGLKVRYLHSDIDTLERMEIVRDLRLGVFDILVGINLLREGLDIPEVSLVAILDADKEGFLRSETSLIQTIGRAARHAEGRVIMYADNVTKSMDNAIRETNRRREIQTKYNLENNITPQSIKKDIRGVINTITEDTKKKNDTSDTKEMSLEEKIAHLTGKMLKCAELLQFEEAARLRDEIERLRKATK